MKKKLQFTLVLVFSLYALTMHAQWQNGLWTGMQAYNWCFPTNSGLNFATSPPQSIYSGMDVNAGNEGFGAISDKEGNLLFYSGPHTAWNRNHEIMLNGEGLLGGGYGSSSQSGLTIPKPNSPGIYYIFTVEDNASGSIENPPSGLRYSEVDMSLDNGLGGITQNKNILLELAPKEKLTATFHADGESIWVVCRDDTSFRSFLVTENGVESVPIITESENITTTVNGQMKFSPDGTKLALINGTDGAPCSLHILDFNNVTGELSNLINLSSLVTSGYYANGIEFSPNSRFVYYVDAFFDADFNLYEELVQLDALAGSEQAIINSKTVLYSELFTVVLSEPQVGPDGKIYLCSMNSATPDMNYDSLSVINYPNNLGFACNFSVNELSMVGVDITAFALPNFIQSYFESGILYKGGQCLGEGLTFSTLRIPGISDITWNFGDENSGAENTSTALTPVHVFSGSGTYVVTATITSNGELQTATTEVIVLPVPELAVPTTENRTLCAENADNTAVFNLTLFTNEILNGQDINAFSVSYFASEEDMEADDPILTTDAFSTLGQKIYVLVNNITTGCTAVTYFDLIVNTLPFANTPENSEQCGDLSGTAEFNLGQLTPEILNGQDAITFSVKYYANETDILNGNPITNIDSFSSMGQTVYAIVINNETSCLSNIVEFLLIVKGPAVIPGDLELSGCSPFNLLAISTELVGNLQLSFYTNESDAIAKTNPITTIEKYPAENGALIYIRAEDIQSCIEIYTMKLQLEGCVIPRGISPNNDSKNDNFDLSFLNIKLLKIFNRYGKQVYSRSAYTNEWYGQEDNGNELPTGTYYYMIETGEGNSSTGWVYINREVN